MYNRYKVILLEKRDIAENTCEIVLSKPFERFRFSAGQYIWLHVPLQFSDPRGDQRAFSIASSPSEPTLRILLRKGESGFKRTLMELPLKSEIEISGPFGSLRFSEDISITQVCVAGGVGVAPLLSLIEDADENQRQQKIVLLYVNQSKEKTPYIDHLTYLASKNANLHVYYINHTVIPEIIKKVIHVYPDSDWLLLGPEAFCTDIARLLHEEKVNENRMFFEEFYPQWGNQPVSIAGDTYKLAIENSSNHIIITDVNGRVLYANPAAEQITGYSFSEMQGQTPRLWGGLMESAYYKSLWHTIKNEKKPFFAEIKNRRKNGEEYIALARISPIISDKKLIGFIGTEEDITAKVEAEENYKKLQERFQGIYNSSRDGIAFSDLEGFIVDVNDSFCNVVGYSKEELIGKKYQDLTPREYHSIEETFVQNLIDTGMSGEIEEELIKKDGVRVPITITVFLVHNINGQVIGLAGLVRDMTVRKKYENNLVKHAQQMEEEKLKDEAILASIGDGVLVIDATGAVLLMNEASEYLLGKKKDDLLGKNFTQEIILHDENQEQIPHEKRPLIRALTNGERIEQFVMINSGQKKLYLGLTVTPVKMQGKIVGAIEVMRDMTRVKEVDKMKTEFISLASHQLRTPLSAMRWFAEMLLNGDVGKLNVEQKNYVQNIYDSNERMINLVNSLLNISRIESGRIIIDPKPTDFIKLVEQVVHDVKIKREEKKQTIVTSYHDNLPLIPLDEKLIREVLLNLLTNAIKYTPEGGEISVIVSKQEDHLLVQTTDNGYGVADSEKQRVFEKFFRGENIMKIETDGTGLGLYLTKAIVESSGGKIWFESKEGKGTSFWFTIPLSGMLEHEGTIVLGS